MPTFIAAGGGDPEQTTAVDKHFASLLPRKKILLIPQAVAPEFWSYKKTYDWVKNRDAFKDVEIEMWENIENRQPEELKPFDALYIMGGNTFTLLDKLRKSGFIQLVEDFSDQGGLVLGLSAGAILMGKSIEIAEIGPPDQADENKIRVTDFEGLNWVGDYTLYTHYRPEEDKELFNYSKRHKEIIIGIPEESALFVEEGEMKVIGTEPIVMIDGERKAEYGPGCKINVTHF